MISEELIDAQLSLERDQIALGLQKLKDNTLQAERKTYASSTVYGAASIAQLHPIISARLEGTRDRISNGTNGRLFAEINQYLDSVETEVIVAIGLRIFFDQIFCPDAEKQRTTTLCMAIGSHIERECQMRSYAKADPDYLDTVKRFYWHSAVGTDQKFRVTQLLFNRKEISWKSWPQPVKLKLGGWIADAICIESGWFVTHEVKANKKSISRFSPTPDFLAQREELMAQAAYLSPLMWPMLIPPAPWTPEDRGGYLLNEVAPDSHLIRRKPGGARSIAPDSTPFQFINNLQNVAYRMNTFVVDVAEVLFERQTPVGSFKPVTILELPPKPLDIATNRDAWKTYCREAAGVYNLNAAAVRQSVRTRCTMEMVARFKDTPRYFIPWSYDYRGRVYPLPSYLGPQDTDFGKSLVRFAEEAPVTDDSEFWLAFHVATTYGLDKSTITERHEWVRLNNDLISHVATDPLGNQSDWECAADPWQFLAACDEFYRCCIARTSKTTGLPVGLDATCSGLQILAGLARDRSTARLVNVIPGERPSDAYRAVAEEAAKSLPPELASQMDRKKVKRTVMTIPYNAKPFSNRSYIRQAFKESGVKLEREQLQKITKSVIDAMNQIVPGPMAVMRWINSEVSEALKRGVTEFTWTTPSGFPVSQKLQKWQTVRVQMALLGVCNLRCPVGPTDQIDAPRHRAATAPNLIHSLDASLIHLAFAQFALPFTVIHDCVLARATDIGLVNQSLRQSFVEIFSTRNYLQEFAAQIEATEPPPIIGDFDPSEVSDSTYFFC
jgi:DNA-directed RNA polymerase